MAAQQKKTLVLGASDDPTRYSFLAIQRLSAAGHPVVAIGKRPSVASGVAIQTEKTPEQGVDTVTLYLNPSRQKDYYNYILSLKPKRIIFNPGAENQELAQMAAANQIQPMEACTLVLLSTGQY